MEFMGIRLDSGRNDANAAVISCDGSPVTVRVMKTDEELMIARHTYNVLSGVRAHFVISRDGHDAWTRSAPELLATATLMTLLF